MLKHNFNSFFIILFYINEHLVQTDDSPDQNKQPLNGRYTRSIENYELIIPHRLTRNGDFHSFKLPQYFRHDSNRKRRRKRSYDDPDLLHYGVSLNGKDYHIELWPNHNFLSSSMIFENREPKTRVKDKKLRTLVGKDICHYTGRVRGHENSRAALSTCDGLTGFITIDNKRYFIEPVDEHQANDEGHHLHLTYPNFGENGQHSEQRCGTKMNWKESWKERYRDKMMKEGIKKDIKRGYASVHKYMEALIVCDKRFMEHHKNRDLENYVLTVMNMVSDFYHDASIGNLMDFVIVRIMYLEKEEQEIDLQITKDGSATLNSFCKWQVGLNPKNDSNPTHHDIAILLTRMDICTSGPKSSCSLQGIATVAGACVSDRTCAVNEDIGIRLAMTVTHEVGHLLGCDHDSPDESKCPGQDKDESFFIMAPAVHMFTTRWSTCSRSFVTKFFDDDLGDCFNDEPTTDKYKFKNALPGVVYDPDAQCNMLNKNAKYCKMGKVCEMLACTLNGKDCYSDNEPAADGTKCGTNQWCFHKKCVEVGERPSAIHGGWGAFSSFSSCSRTCGGGIALASRECNNPVPQYNGRYCLGDRKKVKLCNTQPCALDSPSFREVQCTAQNSKPVEGKLFKWKPHFIKEKPCELHCVNEKGAVHFIAKQAKDGTRCKPGTKNVCVQGVCKKVGCDNQFDSDAVEDICGVCNGDGTQCKIVDEVFKETGFRDYKKFVTIPARSRNIRIEELAPSKNIIAVSDKSEKKFYLNGDWQQDPYGEHDFGRVQGIYTLVEPQKELLTIHGPLKEDLVFLVAFAKSRENVGYRYKYSEPTADSSYTPRYHWELLEWTDCTVICGGGEQTSKYDCVEDKAGKVSSTFCVSEDKPETTTRKCNEAPCATKWKVGKWGPCRACKGKSGVRIREVECVKEASTPGADDVLEEDKKCAGVKPATRELCNSHKTCKSRQVDEIPERELRSVWSQIHQARLKRGIDLDNLLNVINSDEKCGDRNKSNVTITRKLVVDETPENEIKIIKVPMKDTEASFNISDDSFESMGDDVENTMDTKHAKIAVGNAAIQILGELKSDQYDNVTKEESKNSKDKKER